MNYMSQHDRKFDTDNIVIPYLCIITVVFVYMIWQCRRTPETRKYHTELYMKV